MEKILVIDDDITSLLVMTEILIDNDYNVSYAKDGEEGIELFKKNNFEIIISDILMPKKNGIEVMQAIKEINKDVKFLFISGGGQIAAKHFLKVAELLGANELLEKPVTEEKLLNALERIRA